MMKGQKGYVLVQGRVNRSSLGTRLISMITRQLLRWYELHRQRQQLASLSDDALKDIGLSRADTQQEVERPFWNDPMKR
ncbi:DUF1127 domain-containing protein [Pseudomonas sp. UMAB-08]|uniref:DUF1127 domain-containing protein n=1 Tax=Pseudomonas sp. UMAB-08 TaxID=1365375 RepID=UPI001C563D28|nr:DUF1127 domain-containing protein [Pseudomonas sp. UMAB-08]